MFNYNHLFYFYSVVRHGGVTKAAKALHISQPSLTHQVKLLEGELGMKLLKRDGRNVALTQKGKRVYEFCARMFEIAGDLNSYVEGKTSGKTPRFELGVTREVERPFISEIFSKLLGLKGASMPPALSLVSDDHQRHLEKLLIEEIDLLVTTHAVLDPRTKTLAEIQMPVMPVLAAGLAQKMAKESSLSGIIKKTGLVLPSERLLLRFETDSYLQKHRLKGHLKFESDAISGVIRAVEEGVGLGFLPVDYVARELKSKTLKRVNGEKTLWTHKIRFVCLAGAEKTPLISQIRSGLRKPGY